MDDCFEDSSRPRCFCSSFSAFACAFAFAFSCAFAAFFAALAAAFFSSASTHFRSRACSCGVEPLTGKPRCRSCKRQVQAGAGSGGYRGTSKSQPRIAD